MGQEQGRVNRSSIPLSLYVSGCASQGRPDLIRDGQTDGGTGGLGLKFVPFFGGNGMASGGAVETGLQKLSTN